MSKEKPCNHTNTVAWENNTGNLADETDHGQTKVIQLPTGPVKKLILCRGCGRTFAPGTPSYRRFMTAATLRAFDKVAR